MGRQTELIKLYGAMELAPLLDLSDEIVDIVDTGNTLAAHGLVAEKLIANISSRLIVNKLAMKGNFTVVNKITREVKYLIGFEILRGVNHTKKEMTSQTINIVRREFVST